MIKDSYGNRARLFQVCRELRLPDFVADGMVAAAFAIQQQESGKNDLCKSRPLRRHELEKVARLARELSAAIHGLDALDRRDIDREFSTRPLRINQAITDPMENISKELGVNNVWRIGDVLLTVAGIAKDHAERIPGGSKGGRTPVVAWHSYAITNIARLAYPYGIVPGRGGPFHELCEAVFQAAGVKTDPENAIRHFTKVMYPLWLPIWQSEEEKLNTSVDVKT